MSDDGMIRDCEAVSRSSPGSDLSEAAGPVGEPGSSVEAIVCCDEDGAPFGGGVAGCRVLEPASLAIGDTISVSADMTMQGQSQIGRHGVYNCRPWRLPCAADEYFPSPLVAALNQ